MYFFLLTGVSQEKTYTAERGRESEIERERETERERVREREREREERDVLQSNLWGFMTRKSNIETIEKRIEGSQLAQAYNSYHSIVMVIFMLNEEFQSILE
jgi:hypothetical protein